MGKINIGFKEVIFMLIFIGFILFILFTLGAIYIR